MIRRPGVPDVSVIEPLLNKAFLQVFMSLAYYLLTRIANA